MPTSASRNLRKLTQMDGEGLFLVIYHVPEMFRRPRDVAMPRSNVDEWETDVAEFLAIIGKK